MKGECKRLSGAECFVLSSFKPLFKLPGDSWGDVVLALVVVSISDQILAHILHFAASKGRPVVKPPVQDPRLPSKQLYQLSNLIEHGKETKLWSEVGYFWGFIRLWHKVLITVGVIRLHMSPPPSLLRERTSVQGWPTSTIPVRLHPGDPWPRHIKANTYPRITLRPQKHPPEPNISEPSPRQRCSANTRTHTPTHNFSSKDPSGFYSSQRKGQDKSSRCPQSVLLFSSDVLGVFDKKKKKKNKTTSTRCQRRRLRWHRFRSNKYLFVKSEIAA